MANVLCHLCRPDPARLTLALIAFACLALAGCGPDAPPAQAPPAAQAGPTLPDSARQLLGWLPADNEVPGWARAREPRHFTATTLWEYIDGGAESYLRFGFQEVVTLSYADKARSLEVSVDLYRMADPVAAFGIYAQELNPGATFLAIGGEAYADRTSLGFWTGSCYVKLMSSSEHPELPAGLKALATDIARRIGGVTTRPAIFERFPGAGLVPHTCKVVPKDVLGQSSLSGGFEAQYGSGKETWKLTLVPFDAADKAFSALARYRDFVSANATIVRELKAPGKGGFVGRDSYYGTVVAVASGARLAVALGPPSERAGLDAIAHVIK